VSYCTIGCLAHCSVWNLATGPIPLATVLFDAGNGQAITLSKVSASSNVTQTVKISSASNYHGNWQHGSSSRSPSTKIRGASHIANDDYRSPFPSPVSPVELTVGEKLDDNFEQNKSSARRRSRDGFFCWAIERRKRPGGAEKENVSFHRLAQVSSKY